MVMWEMGLVGWLVGMAVNALGDGLPRALNVPSAARAQPRRAPAMWRWLAARETHWDGIAVELLTAFWFMWLAARLNLGFDFGVMAILGVFFLLVALIDLRYQLVFDAVTFPAALAILALQIVSGANGLVVLLGGAFGFAIFAAAAFLRPGDLGGGDVKLATVIGLLFGFPYALWALLIGVLAGGVVVAGALITRRGGWQTRIPYAPFLCFGALSALVYNPVVALYPVAVWRAW